MLLDLIMPEMSGNEMLAALRTKQEFVKLPVIVLTNTESEKTEVDTNLIGVSAYIVKANETPTQVVTRVKAVLGLDKTEQK